MTTTHTHNTRHYKYFDLIMASFVAVLLCSNMIGPGKSCLVTIAGYPLVFGAGNLFFPISYIFGDVLTEVYGYARARKVIWAGFGAMLFYVLMSQIVIAMPVNPAEPFNQQLQPALEICFGASWRIVAASILAFWAGDFVNSFVLAKMKLLTGGRMLWTRTIGSTVVGQGVDSLIFYPLAFWGIWEPALVFSVMATNYALKVLWEALLTPVTYRVVAWFKAVEGLDVYDTGTDFTPFKTKV